jgi:hypothetical protein
MEELFHECDPKMGTALLVLEKGKALPSTKVASLHLMTIEHI